MSSADMAATSPNSWVTACSSTLAIRKPTKMTPNARSGPACRWSRASDSSTQPQREPLNARVGIATGLVVVGDLIGSGEAQERGIAGETPNLAARLQGLAEPGAVIIADGTRRLVGDLFELSGLTPSALKGFAEPVRAWRVLGEGHAESRFEALHGTRLTPLVGRGEELELVLSRWRQAKEGSGQVALISGEPGIGKSRLVLSLGERLHDEPKATVSYACSPHHVHSALFPFIAQLERSAGFSPTDSSEARLSRLESLLRETVAEPGDAAGALCRSAWHSGRYTERA